MKRILPILKSHAWHIVIVSLLCAILFQGNYHYRNSVPLTSQLMDPQSLAYSLEVLDGKLRREFDDAKGYLCYHLKKGEHSDKMEARVEDFLRITGYGITLQQYGLGCDPGWATVASYLRDYLCHDPLFRSVTKEDYRKLLHFMEDHEYRSSTDPLTQEDLEYIGEIMAGVAQRDSEALADEQGK